ncbi:MAG: dihydroorotase [Bacteroidota bacterium]|nr:dihydroorotase [Bacteroidota bacterium]
MKTTLIKNAKLVNEGEIYHADVYIKGTFIEKIERQGIAMAADEVIDAQGLYLLPGLIDDQVHFREPGLTHKGEIYTEAKAAVAGGITSYMEMPNTSPSATTIELLEQKYQRASACSLANYSFFMGTTNTNLSELLKVDPSTVCGVKIFMGSSTGDMLVDDPNALEQIFAQVKTLIATHCENDPMVKQNQAAVLAEFGEDIDASFHPKIRNEEACYTSSAFAVSLAKKHGTRLHILHISTAKELDLFDNTLPLVQKKITAEACVHHLWFSDADYATKGNWIKWNPAVKKASDRDAILQAVIDNRIDVIATDHAPHTIEEKENKYIKAPSGGPLVQHSLNALLQLHKEGKISLEKIVEKACHNVAILFEIDRRGYIREGFYADLVLVDLNQSYTVNKENILYKCQWSPFEGQTFDSKIRKTFVNGHLVYNEGEFDESSLGMRMRFNR